MRTDEPDDPGGRTRGAVSGDRPPGVPADYQPVIPMDRSFDALYGLEVLEPAPEDGPDTMRGRVAIREELRQQTGLLHGGVLAAVAEALASWGTWRGAATAGIAVMGMSNETSFLRSFSDGHVHALATAVHRGRTRWLWETRFSDDAGQLCAVSLVNIAIRPRR